MITSIVVGESGGRAGTGTAGSVDNFDRSLADFLQSRSGKIISIKIRLKISNQGSIDLLIAFRQGVIEKLLCVHI